jgi:predicted amidohydrolase YtcJ
MDRRRFLKVSALTAAGLLSGYPRIEASVPQAEMILLNGRIVTVDPQNSIAEAIAARGGRILAVGPTPEIRAFAGPDTAVIDLQGKTVTPGLIDSHAHLPPFGSRELLWVKLQGIQSKEKILESIAARAEKMEPGSFINAWGLESHDLAFLNRRDLDEVTTKHPVLVVHTTGQWGFANSAALKLGGVDQSTESPPGSRVEKGSSGEPTGLLVHYPALYLVRRAAPVPNERQMKRIIGHAAELYAREGVTSVQDNFFMVTGMSSAESSRLYFDLAASGELPVRLKVWPYLPTFADTQDAVAELFGDGKPNPASPFFELGAMKREDPASFDRVWGGLKIAIDGSGPTAGWSRNPNALMLHPPAELRQMVDIIHRAGQQVSVHATGDQAVDTMLDVFEAAQKAHPRPDPRHRIEHAILPTSAAFRRLRKLGIIVSTHPQFIFAWGDQWMGMRKSEFIPVRSFMDNQIPLAFGADPPAFPLWQPQYALWQAVARVTRRGDRFSSGESISIAQALRIQTMGSAFAAFQERDLGSLEKGKLADMVVWDRDFPTVPTEQIRDAKALITIVGGKIVFEKNKTEKKDMSS